MLDDHEALVRSLLAAKPDITLAEIQAGSRQPALPA